MFRLLCVCAVLVVLGADAVENNLEYLRNELTKACRKKHPISDEELKRFADNQPFQTPDGNCFINCVFENHMDFHKNGKFDLEVVKEAIKRNSVSPSHEKVSLHLVEICAKHVKPEDKDCEQAKKLYNCLTLEKEKYLKNIKKN